MDIKFFMLRNNISNFIIVIYCIILIIFMLGVIYLITPIYQFICKNTEYFKIFWNFFLILISLENLFILKII